MKKMLWLVMVMLVSGSVFGQGTNAWKIAEKYDRKIDGWVRGGSMSKGGVFGVDKTSGKMGAPSALRVRMKNITGEMEITKVFKIPAPEQGKNISVDAMMGYNFVNEYVGTGPNAPGGTVSVEFSVKLFNRRNELVVERKLSREDKKGGDLQGTSLDMEMNSFTFTDVETKEAASMKVSLKAKVDAAGNRPQRQNVISELWIRSLTIKEQE